jgi:hypothetical protein
MLIFLYVLPVETHTLGLLYILRYISFTAKKNTVSALLDRKYVNSFSYFKNCFPAIPGCVISPGDKMISN